MTTIEQITNLPVSEVQKYSWRGYAIQRINAATIYGTSIVVLDKKQRQRTIVVYFRDEVCKIEE